MKDDGQQEGTAVYPSIDDCFPDEGGGPLARAGFTYQDHVAADLILDMIADPTVVKIHCETMDDIVVISEVGIELARVAEFVQVKTTTRDSLWSCARLCGAPTDEPGTSVFEKSLAKDKVKEEARFRIVTSQAVHSSLKILTFERSNSARAVTSAGFLALKEEIDKRCPNAISAKGAQSNIWLQRVLWVEGPSLEMLKQKLLLKIIIRSHKDGATLLADQAEKVLLSLLDWVKRAGDAKFVPDKDKKIITRSQALQWFNDQVSGERAAARTDSGEKLRRKMSSDVASPDIAENALELRRHYSEEIRAPKYMEPPEASALAMDVRVRLMTLRMKRFSGENDEPPSNFHQRCFDSAAAAAEERAQGDSILRALALGCLYDIVDRCQLEFSRRPL